jgi:hypothetical protein
MSLLKSAAFIGGLIGLLWLCAMVINEPGFNTDTSLKRDLAKEPLP